MREKLIKIVQLNPREWKRLPQLLESKRELFEGKFILLPHRDSEKEKLLKEAGINYIITNGECFQRPAPSPTPIDSHSQQSQSSQQPQPDSSPQGEQTATSSSLSTSTPEETSIFPSNEEEFHKPREVEIIDRVVRSGQEIITDNDLIFTQRVNGGARIVTSGNVIALEQFEGELVCNGQFLVMLKNKGSIIFDGEEIEPSDKIVVAVDNGRKVEL
ncbi:MAG: hypothetical protein C6I01_01100 [Epsilonproteobacteria bacterium]|jgi:septum formation inhibitor MinC|nr:hypothetical protein [Campylobacterota bacterium]NPA89776.1 hypothetical protein [Campylobacterota bacterium]